MARGGRDVRRHHLRIARRGVDARADCRSAQGQLPQMVEGVPQSLQPKIELSHVAAELLTEGQRRGVHQVRPPDFDDIHEGCRFGGEAVAKPLNAGNRHLNNLRVRRDVHRGGVGVIRRLGFVHVVVGVDGLVALAQHTAIEDMRTVGDHLVDIHVGLGSTSSLPNHQGKGIIELSRQDLPTNRNNPIALFGRQDAEIGIRLGSRFLQMGKGPHNFERHGAGWADSEIVA